MKHIIIATCLILILLKANATDPTPITKADILKWKTVEQALNLPSGYEVVECGIMFTMKDETFAFPGNTGMIQWIQSFINIPRTGDKLLFEKILVRKGTRNIKLEDKVYKIL